MISKTTIIQGRYYDSVTLMNVARRVNKLPGVVDAAVVMGTAANKEILRTSGMYVPDLDNTSDADLLVVLKGNVEAELALASAEIDTILKDIRKRRTGDGLRPRSLEGALQTLSDANLAVISVAGHFAGDLAINALQQGLHVMLFSDNVPLETEIQLKRYAHEHGLLVMGPDCGTAIINGASLAFANVVRRGSIGAVAAAGTGLQEVSSLVHNLGGGISQAIGTGGRDTKLEVGGITFLDGLDALANDPATEVIVLISKPPHPSVLTRVGERVRAVGKPVVAVFLGSDTAQVESFGMIAATTLEEAAVKAVAAASGNAPAWPSTRDLASRVEAESDRLGPSQKYVRGLFTGGTFCYEAQVVLQGSVDALYSNTPAARSKQLQDVHKSIGHTLIDLGDDAFTVGRPHPMIDFSTRNRRILQEADDPETAVILLDLVLGHGSNLTPIEDLLPTLEEAQRVAHKNNRHVPLVCSVTGTNDDPQYRDRVVDAMRIAGVLVERSNAAACRLAGDIVARIGAAV